MKLSARNQLSGTVESITGGNAMAVVAVTLAGGGSLTASLTRASVEDLGLAPGSPVVAVVKSTDVMLAVPE